MFDFSRNQMLKLHGLDKDIWIQGLDQQEIDKKNRIQGLSQQEIAKKNQIQDLGQQEIKMSHQKSLMNPKSKMQIYKTKDFSRRSSLHTKLQ